MCGKQRAGGGCQRVVVVLLLERCPSAVGHLLLLQHEKLMCGKGSGGHRLLVGGYWCQGGKALLCTDLRKWWWGGKRGNTYVC